MTPYQKHLQNAQKRRAKIVHLATTTKMTQVEIAKAVKVTPPRVHKVLKQEGII